MVMNFNKAFLPLITIAAFSVALPAQAGFEFNATPMSQSQGGFDNSGDVMSPVSSSVAPVPEVREESVMSGGAMLPPASPPRAATVTTREPDFVSSNFRKSAGPAARDMGYITPEPTYNNASYTTASLPPARQQNSYTGDVYQDSGAAQPQNYASDAGYQSGERWEVTGNESLQNVLEGWSRREGMGLIWNTGNVYLFDAPFFLKGSYTEAVERALNQFSDQPGRPVGAIYNDPETGRPVLVVSQE
ncbi:MAG: hypothetical protein CMH28_06695 [Micavibrio sp.]|nr:hypothetical protein [Micavibrio sp.]